MATQRYISTSFWSDKWIRTLDPSERYLYMYLLTNTETNIAGVYQLTLDRIAFDTGYDERTLRPMLDRMAKAGKAELFDDEWMIIPSWPKHQKYATHKTIESGINSVLKELPKRVIERLKTIGYAYPMDSLPIGHTYPPSYSDLHSDLHLNLNSDIDSSAGSSPSQEIIEEPEHDVFEAPSPTTRLEHAIEAWNAKAPKLPKYRYSPISMPIDHRSDALRTLGAYTDAEIAEAVETYAKIVNDSARYKAFPLYVSFVGFMRAGVEAYSPEANPYARCRIDTKGAPREVDPETEEAIKRTAEKYVKGDDGEDYVQIDMGAFARKIREKATA
jgi:hypothetical protein